MAKLTMVFGALLIALGVGGFVGTGSAHPTALIPAYLGAALFLCGLFANTEDAKKRMLWMHIAVTLGLLGFLGTAPMVVMAYVKAHGGPLVRPFATESQLAMALLCLIFTGLCVRSFIAARRARANSEAV